MTATPDTTLPAPHTPHALGRSDIWSMERYAVARDLLRKQMVEQKRIRRFAVGPHASFLFENWDTLWMQVHEMLWIERGGDEQIEDELSAYASLVPAGNELVATVMFEIPDEALRRATLARLGGVEECMVLEVEGERIRAVSETDLDRTTAAGKASSVQFAHFPLEAQAAAAFRRANTRVSLSIDHPAYGHSAVVPEAVRAVLAPDLD